MEVNTPRRLGCSRNRSHSSGEFGTTPMQCTAVRVASRSEQLERTRRAGSGGMGNTPPITATTVGSRLALGPPQLRVPPTYEGARP